MTDWKGLFEKLNEKNGKKDVGFSPANYIFSQIGGQAVLSDDGRQILYNGGQRLLTWRGSYWETAEKESVRWEYAKMDEEARNILDKYKAHLERLLSEKQN